MDAAFTQVAKVYKILVSAPLTRRRLYPTKSIFAQIYLFFHNPHRIGLIQKKIIVLFSNSFPVS